MNVKYCNNNKNKIFTCTICTVIIIVFVSIVCVYAKNDRSIMIDDSNLYNVSEFNNKTMFFNNSNKAEGDTLCRMISQLSIRYSNKIVTVCMYNYQIRVDIREFYSNVPSIRGIWFLINEWKEFCKIMFEINKAVNFQQFQQYNNITY